MSDSDSVIIETKLRSGSDLDEGIRNLSLLDTDDNLKFELESGKKRDNKSMMVVATKLLLILAKMIM